MAQEPVQMATPFERARMARVNKAAVDSPLLNGYRWVAGNQLCVLWGLLG